MIDKRRAITPGLGTLGLGVLSLAAFGCGTNANPTTQATTTTHTSTTNDSGSQPVAIPGDGLRLRIAGTVEGDLLCPGDRRPCLAFDGSLELGPSDVVWVTGQVAGDRFVIDEQHSLPEDVDRDYGNRCPETAFSSSVAQPILEQIYEDPTHRPQNFADLWDSDDGVVHLAVADDDATAAEAFLRDRGIEDQVCLVTGFAFTADVLESAQQQVAAVASAGGYDGFGVSADRWQGTVTIDVPIFGRDLRTRLDEISEANGGVPITALASVEVLNGSRNDYAEFLDSVGTFPDVDQQLRASCGSVAFSSVPPDPEEFPPLDADAKSALGEFDKMPESAQFVAGYQWSMANVDADKLVLFGKGPEDQVPPWAHLEFERQGGVWKPVGWGGCWVEISASGLGPAAVAIDPSQPPDPADTQLQLQIQEVACASGEAPTDREVLPLVTESEDSITVVVLVAPIEGGATCQGNPWHPLTVTLNAAVASRTLLDGHQFPAQPIGSPDEHD